MRGSREFPEGRRERKKDWREERREILYHRMLGLSGPYKEGPHKILFASYDNHREVDQEILIKGEQRREKKKIESERRRKLKKNKGST